MGINDAMSSVNGVLRGAVGLGMALAVVFLAVDILFGLQTNIVGNLTGVIRSFTSQGVVGLIALVVFISMYRN